MLRAASVSQTEDLRPLLVILRTYGVHVRVSEEAGAQVIWVRDERDAEAVRRALAVFDGNQQQRIEPTASSFANQAVAVVWHVLRFARSCPLTAALALVTLAVALLSRNGREVASVAVLFFPALNFSSATDLLLQLLSPVLLLRSLTPALLHFGELHLVFNLLWLLYFGRQLERVQPTAVVFMLYVMTAFAGNFVQYYTSGSAAFGGLSGLIYGLVGYTWLLGILAPNCGIQLRTSTFAVFVVALFAMAVLASGTIASGAHLGGLLAGLVCAVLVAVRHKLKHTNV